jgi:uncharacterized protein
MKRVIDEQRLAFVATVDPDGTPNLSPKGTIAVLDDDHLMFADLASPRTIENLRRNAAVELNVVDVTTRTGYRFKGRGVVLGEGERFQDLIDMYGRGPRALTRATERIRHVVIVEVERCLKLVSPAYDLGSTESEISERWERYFTELWAARRQRCRNESSSSG